MFLATTALTEFWGDSPELFCLGQWCLRHDRQAEWASRRVEVLPCPWDDRERFYRAAQEADAASERLLCHLSGYLNVTHGVSYPKRYWRILFGSWLAQYVHVIHDRYTHLAEALTAHPDLQTIVMDPASFRVPNDTADTMNLINGDPYNLQLFSQLLQEMGHRFPARPFRGSWTAPENGEITKDRTWLQRLTRTGVDLAVWLAKRAQGSRWRVDFHDLDCSKLVLVPLIARMGGRVLPAHLHEAWAHDVPSPQFDDRRTGLSDLPWSSEFERLAVRLLPHHFPTLYLEGYHTARAEAMRRSPAAPLVIVSATVWYFNEPFKFVAAEAAHAGTKLVAVQHGGGYGMYRFCPSELLEVRTADTFLAWGWTDQQPGARYRNLPNPKLSSLVKNRRNIVPTPEARTILFVATCHPRYLYRFQSTPVGSQWTDYIQWQRRFLKQVPARVRAAVVFRPYLYDYGHGLRAQVSADAPEMRWENGTSMAERLRHSRLVVIDHLGTTLLETLALNIPTIMFWDPRRWEVREDAAPYLDELRDAGMLWDSPEAAATKVAQIAGNPRTWWENQQVQAARRRFADHYALAQEDWVDWWARAFDELMAGQEPLRS